MSKKNHNNNVQTNAINEENVVVPDDVNVSAEGVTPDEEGVNSIDETVENNDAVNAESENEEVSVADTQESEENKEEDSTATNSEENVVPTTNPVVPPVQSPDEKQPEVTKEEPEAPVEKVQVVEDAFYISLGVVPENRMELTKERLKKAGVKSASLLEDVLVVGPFKTEADCIKVRKAIVGKGLKSKIIKH